MAPFSPRPSNLSIITTLLKECIDTGSLWKGAILHSHLLKSGFLSRVFISNRLLQIYYKCDVVSDARKLFDEMPERDSITWNIMIASSVKSRSMEDARLLFNAIPQKTEISWNTIIMGYVQEGNCSEALDLFVQMLRQGWSPTHFSVPSVLQACAVSSWLSRGKQLHCLIYRFGLEGNVFACTSLVDMYCNCGELEYARRCFDRMADRSIISWNAILTGYSQNSLSEDCFQTFIELLNSGLRPDHITFAVVLSSTAAVANLVQGKQLHGIIVKTRFGLDVFVQTALINAYAKSGSLDDARLVFNSMTERNRVTWSSMIIGYAQNGRGREAILLFEDMLNFGIKPDSITFVGVLMACSHSGLVDEGRHYFNSMKGHGVEPDRTHYTSMVDLLGRAGYLKEAKELINSMQVKPDAAIWNALLGACRVHRNLEIGKIAASRVFELEPNNASAHMLLCHIFTESGQWDEVAKLRVKMKSLGIKKDPGCSWIEVDNEIHTFVADDESHPQTKELYLALRELNKQIEDMGYKYYPNPLFEEGRQSYHSEKLAIAFGLISTPSWMAIRIMKNLRICGDCHTTIKFISQITGREIIVRDVCRFHHFSDGKCSCGDYW